jgi:hypothetical protein
LNRNRKKCKFHSLKTPPKRRQRGGVGFVFQKGLAQSSGFDAQFLKIILWPCTKLEGAAKLKITSSKYYKL